MDNHSDDARATPPDGAKRITMEGRSFGKVSYATDESGRSGPLRRTSSGSVAVDHPAPRVSTEHRDTGARKRMSSS